MAGLKRRSSEATTSNNTNNTTPIENLVNNQEYEGRLVYVADLGLHSREYKGEVKSPCQKIALGIEIIGETITFEGKEVPRILWTKPFNIFYCMSDKGKELEYYKMFESSAKDGDVGEWQDQMGKPINVTVTHFKKDDNVYDNIGSLAPIPAKYQGGVGEATTEPCIGDADDENNPCTKALFGLVKWMFDQRIVEGTQQQPQEEEPPAFVDEDMIPF